jgi:hypothetical protein
MERTQLAFLNARDASQQFIRRGEVVGCRGALRHRKHVSNVL